MRKIVIGAAAVLALALGAATPSVAANSAALQTVAYTHGHQQPLLRKAGLNERQIARSLERQGYSRVSRVQRQTATTYSAYARTKFGRNVFLRVNAFTGTIVSIRRA